MAEKMKIEVLEEELKAKDRVTGRHYALEEGDRVTVSAETGRAWCDAGWVRDLSGEYETGERVVRGVTVRADRSEHATSDTNDEEEA